MIQHFLNGVEVFSQKGTSIKVTKENPILTDSSTYTLDVNFPLSISANKKFFGALNRIDVSKENKTYNLKVLKNGLPMLVGTAKLTNVKDDCVTVQYVAGNSNVNFWNKVEEQYIDEYDYNTQENGTDIVKNYMGQGNLIEKEVYKDGGEESKVYFTYFLKLVKDFDHNEEASYSLFRGQKHIFTFCKVYDESHSDEEQTIPIYGNGQSLPLYGKSRINYLYRYYNCIQPNLLWILVQICKKNGYELDTSLFKDTPVEDIYIASARQTLEIADALPHWTVKEFIEQFQNLMNVTIVFDDVTLTASIRKNEDILSANLVEIKSITDEKETEISDDAIETLDNVKYKDWEDSFYIIASDDVREKKHILYSGNSFNGLYGLIDDTPLADKMDCIFACTKKPYEGKKFLWNGGKGIHNHVEIDKFGPAGTDYDDAVELKIHPAKTVMREYLDCDYSVIQTTGWECIYNDILIETKFYHNECVLDMTNSWGGYTETEKSLYEKLEDGDDITSRTKEDDMQIFFCSPNGDGKRKQSRCHVIKTKLKKGTAKIDGESTEEDVTDDVEFWTLPVSEPHIEKEYLAREDYAGRVDGSLRLKYGSVASWYLGERFGTKVGYEGKVVHQYPFISNSIPDVRARFLINGKMFACQKIEYNIEDDGINPLMTGYFIEIKS